MIGCIVAEAFSALAFARSEVGRISAMVEAPAERGLRRRLDERGDRDRPGFCDGLAQGLDALDFVQGPSREVRSPARRARPHRDALDDEQVGSLAVAARDVLELNPAACAGLAADFNRGRP